MGSKEIAWLILYGAEVLLEAIRLLSSGGGIEAPYHGPTPEAEMVLHKARAKAIAGIPQDE